MIEPIGATVQPARLALGLRRRLLEAGRRDLRVLARRPLPRSRTTGSRRPPRPAPASARRAGVLAIGGAARSRRGPLAGRLTVASSHIIITEPVPDVVEKLGWTGGEAITDGRALVHYFRTTPDGRIAFGWGGGRIAMGARTHGRAEVDADVIEAQRRHLLEYFPDLAGRRITHAWGGPIDASPTHLPAITSLQALPRLGRRGLHRQRRRPDQHDRPQPRLPGPRPAATTPPASPSSTAPCPASPPSPSTGSAAKRSAWESPRRSTPSATGRSRTRSPQQWRRSPTSWASTSAASRAEKPTHVVNA